LDKIHIRDILLRCIIGIFEEERREKQDVVINITLHADLAEAGKTDDFATTLDYKAVVMRIVELVEGSSYFLLEALAEAIAQACLGFELVKQADVLVEKPGALDFARTVGVEISRTSC
jgi:dihydroneopterin aldolase/D-erythro-7,8-dihydroneopterin triphosphate epimerase